MVISQKNYLKKINKTLLSEGSVQDYYKSIERLVHYEKKNDFCSTSKYILRDINSR